MAVKRILTLMILVLAGWVAVAQSDSPGESDASSDAAQKEVERVLNAGLPFAERILDAKGEFAPFGAVMLEKGLIQTLTPDSADNATSESMLQSLVIGLRRGANSGDYRAVGIFAMVEMRDPKGEGTFSAVHVGLESRDGYCVDVYYPVVLRGEGLVLDDPVAGKRSGTFFGSCR